MTVETTTRKENFAGGQSALSYTFRARPSAPSDIKVDITAGGTSSTLTYTSHYTVTVASDGIGGTVHVSPSYSTAYTYTVYRETTNTQASDYDDYNQFPADTLEASLDQVTLINQEQAEEIARSVKLPVSTTLSNITISPSAGAAIGWDSAGTGITNYINPNTAVTTCTNLVSTASTQAVLAGNYATSASTSADLAANYATTASTQATLAGNYATTCATIVASAGTLQNVFDNGQSITIADTDNQTLAITQNDTTNNPKAVSITNTGTGNSIYVNHDGAGATTAVDVDYEGTGSALNIDGGGVLINTASLVSVYSNAAQTNSSTLLSVKMDNASSSAPCETITNDGTGNGLFIDQNGNGKGIYIENAGTERGLQVKQSGAAASAGLEAWSDTGNTKTNAYFLHQGVRATDNTHNVYIADSGANVTANTATVLIEVASGSQTEPALEITNAGSGAAIELTGNAGIKFPASVYSSSDANTLDDYEEGTWTPSVATGITSPTYTTQSGYYTKIGDIMLFQIKIVLSGGTPNGSAVVVTLPKTAQASIGDTYVNVGIATAASGATNIKGRITQGTSSVTLVTQTATAISSYVGTSLGSGGNFSISGMVKVQNI